MGARVDGVDGSSIGLRALRVGGRRMQLFCAWLSWSRFRVVAPAWDQTLGTLVFHVWTPHLRRIVGAADLLADPILKW